MNPTVLRYTIHTMERRPISPELLKSIHLRVAFLASHNGTSMQAALEAMREGKINAEPTIIISNNSREGAIQAAKEQEIPWAHISNVTHPNTTDEAIRDALLTSKADLVICSGWNKIIGNKTLEAFPNRIINIHPAIHEEFMGDNWMDLAVHEAVIKAGKKLSGYTMHLMTPVVDEGQVITTGTLRG